MTLTRSGIHFLLASAILAGGAAYMQAAHNRGWLRVLKGALPLRKPLDEFDRRALSPYIMISAERLAAETVQDLGTKDYLHWALRDGAAVSTSTRPVTLFVTYYTGVQDQVPHVPEECLNQAAFSPGSDETLKMSMTQLGHEIEVRRLSFFPPRQTGNRLWVYYTICVNGDFFGNRNYVRARMANPWDTHLYYSKIEVAFSEEGGMSASRLDEKARSLLDQAISELVKSHWPPKGSERRSREPAKEAGAGRVDGSTSSS